MFSRAILAAAFGAALPLLPALPTIAGAAEPSGQAVAVRVDAQASGTGGQRVLEVNGPVFSGDVVKTDAGGSAQIHFADDTRMVIGPNSNVTLDSFVFASQSKASKFTINALRGSFRFITGASAKNVYTINTPTATIGVRGTQFDTQIADDGTTTTSLWEGGIRICDRATPKHCTEVVGTCSMIQITPQNVAKRINGVYDRTAVLDANFPFAFRQNWLEPDFRVVSSGCDVRDLNANPHSDGTNPPPTPPTRSEGQ